MKYGILTRGFACDIVRKHFRTAMTKPQVTTTIATLLFLAAAPLLAQNAPTLRQSNTEIGLFVGGGYGLGQTDTGALQGNVTGSSMHVMGGGDFGYAISKSFFLVGEASYFPTLSQVDIRTTQTVGTGTPAQTTFQNDDKYDRKLVEFNGGVHYRLPVPESRFVPYLVGGLGGVHFSTSSQTKTSKNLSTGDIQNSSQGPLPSVTVFAYNVGAGARLYVTEHFGFRGEFRYFRPSGIDNLSSFYRVAGGIFFQLK